MSIFSTAKPIPASLKLAFTLFVLTIAYLPNSNAKTNDELIGVWQRFDSRGEFARIEFTSDNRYIRWKSTSFRSRGVSKVRLEKLSDYPIVDSSTSHVRVNRNGEQLELGIVLSNGGLWLEFVRAGNQPTGKSSAQWHKAIYGAKGKPSYNSHQYLVFEADIGPAITSENIDLVKNFLNTPESNFLREESSDRAQAHKDGELDIASRIWEKVHATENLTLINLFYEKAPIGAKTEKQLKNAMSARNQTRIDFYRDKLGYSDGKSASKKDIEQFNFLYSIGGKLSSDLSSGQAAYMIHPPYGCGREKVVTNDKQTQQLRMLQIPDDPKIKARAKWAQEILEKQYDYSFYFAFIEDEYTRCLNSAFGKPVSLDVINMSSISGINAVKPKTLLYHYAQSRKDQSKLAKYAILNALLDFGADPTIRPNKDSLSLIEEIFVNGSTETFGRMLDSHSTAKRKGRRHLKQLESDRSFKNFRQELKAYNSIMKRIGGPAYTPGQTLESMAQFKVSTTSKPQSENQASQHSVIKHSASSSQSVKPVDRESKEKVRKKFPETSKISQDNSKSTTSSKSSYEVGVNLPFGDIGAQPLNKADARLCLEICLANAQCKSWTYVKPGVQDPKAMCWIKNIVPNSVNDKNTISGVMKR